MALHAIIATAVTLSYVLNLTGTYLSMLLSFRQNVQMFYQRNTFSGLFQELFASKLQSEYFVI